MVEAETEAAISIAISITEEEERVGERARLVNFVAAAANVMVIIVAFRNESISPRTPIGLLFLA
jgi:hypothetical protein